MSLLVVGGAGCLGRSVLRSFRASRPGFNALSVDLVPSEDASESVVLDPPQVSGVTAEVAEEAAAQVRAALRNKAGGDQVLSTIDTIVCTAGSWAGGYVGTPEGLRSVDSMIAANLQSAITTAYLATQFLTPGGLVVFSGAEAALGPTPFMAGYGMAKAATHHLASSLASSVGDSDGGLPEGARVTTILPGVIDTPGNREAMPSAVFDEWANPEDIAAIMLSWSEENFRLGNPDAVEKRAAWNGSFHKLVTCDGTTTAKLHFKGE